MPSVVKHIAIAFFTSVLLSVAVGYFKGVDIYYLKSIEDYKFEKLYLTKEEYVEYRKDEEEKKNLVHEHTFYLKSALIFGTVFFSLSSLLLIHLNNKNGVILKKIIKEVKAAKKDETYGMTEPVYKLAKISLQKIQNGQSSFQSEVENTVKLFEKYAKSLSKRGDTLLIELELRDYFNYLAVYSNQQHTYETYFPKYPVLY
jgi:hypothetical protein